MFSAVCKPGTWEYVNRSRLAEYTQYADILLVKICKLRGSLCFTLNVNFENKRINCSSRRVLSVDKKCCICLFTNCYTKFINELQGGNMVANGVLSNVERGLYHACSLF